MVLTRRDFIKNNLAGLAAAYLPKHQLSSAALKAKAANDRVLVMVCLSGGNDGLNTLVPYGKGAYYDLRPTIAIPAEHVLIINNELGLHSAMKELHNMFVDGKLAVIQGVGYPDPSYSHFRSHEIWQTAYPDKIISTYWLDRYLDVLSLHQKDVLPVLNLDSTMLSLHPENTFINKLNSIVRMINSGTGCTIYSISLQGFDTHTNQVQRQEKLLKELSSSLAAFYQDLVIHGSDSNVITLIFSEFGRSVAENNDQGTDHGTIQPVFVLGTKVKGGIYGEHPHLSKLQKEGLNHKIDFRSVYATILDDWLQADSKAILGQQFDHLGFIEDQKSS